MTRKISYSLPRGGPDRTRLTLKKLMNAQRPLLFSRMPRMLRGDGRMGIGSLLHEFRYFEGIQRDPAPVSAQRWKVALETSRILRAQRRRASRLR